LKTRWLRWTCSSAVNNWRRSSPVDHTHTQLLRTARWSTGISWYLLFSPHGMPALWAICFACVNCIFKIFLNDYLDTSSQNLLDRASNATELSASGDGRLCPPDLHLGLCPLTPAGGSAPDPYIGSCSRARHDQAQPSPQKKPQCPGLAPELSIIILLRELHMHKATRATFLCTIQDNCWA